ncbi:MAG TPA: putative Ig domain-containing protein [Vicinamibacterales bacterium]|nr:putative Ig domain-containing protein [Vicinamibacterales bacterium]
MRTLDPGRRRILLSAVFVLLFAVEARAGSTSLLLTGDPGDYITGGRTMYFTAADGAFTAYRNYDNGVSIGFNTPNFGHWWYLNFAAAGDQYLTPGVYANAIRWPFQLSTPGLSIYGDGRGCNVLSGSFEVKEVVYGPGAPGTAGSVLAFRATFEQHCEGWAAAARGEIRYNATVAIDMTAPSTMSVLERQPVAFTVRAADTDGRHVALSAAGVPQGALFVDNGDNTGTFSWLPLEGQAGTYLLTFRGDNGAGQVETIYTALDVIAVPPLNDDFSSPIVIEQFPYTNVQTTAKATSSYDDPFCAGSTHTVWYAFTPSNDMRVEFNTFGSDYDTTLAVYTGRRGALSQVACNDNAGGAQSRVRFDAQAGVTYWIMAGGYYWASSGRLQLNLLQAPPPLTIALALTESGGVDPTTGQAVVGGSITCSRPLLVSISGQLKQDHAQSSLTGRFALVVACDGTTDWTAAVVTSPGVFQGRAADLFVAGRAHVTATAEALDEDTGEKVQSNAAVRVVLRGGVR